MNDLWDKELSDEEFDSCVRKDPWRALHYEHACTRMSEQFNNCVTGCFMIPPLGRLLYSMVALTHPHACKRLSDIQLDHCLKDSGRLIVKHPHEYTLFARLNPYQKAWLELMKDQLNPYQEDWADDHE